MANFWEIRYADKYLLHISTEYLIRILFQAEHVCTLVDTFDEALGPPDAGLFRFIWYLNFSTPLIISIITCFSRTASAIANLIVPLVE